MSNKDYADSDKNFINACEKAGIKPNCSSGKQVSQWSRQGIQSSHQQEVVALAGARDVLQNKGKTKC